MSSGARWAASWAVTDPYDQPKSAGFPATPEWAATHLTTVITSLAARSGVSHPEESRAVPP